MLLRFTVANHASIREPQELDCLALDQSDDRALSKLPRGRLALPAVGVYGPNASGKSNLVGALRFVQTAVLRSHQRWLPDRGIPRTPFRLDTVSGGRPSEFTVEFLAEGIWYEFSFSCDNHRFLSERLTGYPQGRARTFYERTDDGLKFGALRGQRQLVKKAMRDNSLYLSAAAANNMDSLAPAYNWFNNTLRIATDQNADTRLQETREVFENPDDTVAVDILKYADVGAVGVNFRDIPLTADQQRRIREFILALFPEPQRDLDRTIPQRTQIEVLHDAGDGTSVPLPLEMESSGTQVWLSLIGPVLKSLRFGRVLVVDELDARLHHHLAAHLVALFQSPETNPHGAQLVFNSHDATLFGPDTKSRLTRDQVWITEKIDGATRLYPLSDYKVRTTDNLEKRYLSGRYGGLPFFDRQLLEGLMEELRA